MLYSATQRNIACFFKESFFYIANSGSLLHYSLNRKLNGTTKNVTNEIKYILLLHKKSMCEVSKLHICCFCTLRFYYRFNFVPYINSCTARDLVLNLVSD